MNEGRDVVARVVALIRLYDGVVPRPDLEIKRGDLQPVQALADTPAVLPNRADTEHRPVRHCAEDSCRHTALEAEHLQLDHRRLALRDGPDGAHPSQQMPAGREGGELWGLVGVFRMHT